MLDEINHIKGLMQTDLAAAGERAAQLLDRLGEGGSNEDRAAIYHLLGLVAYYGNKAQEAIKWYTLELKLREKIKDKKGASDVLNNIGVIYLNQAKLSKAKQHFDRALAFSEDAKDMRGQVKIYNNLGLVLLKLGMSAEAYAIHTRALEINRSLGDIERICISLQNIGMVYSAQGDYDYALAHYHEALALAQENKDMTSTILIMINIGSAYIQKGNVAEAKKYYLLSYAKSRENSYHHGLIVSLQSLGYIEQIEGHYAASINHYAQCIKSAETTGHIAEITVALCGIGVAYTSLRDYDQALKYLQDALAMARRTNVKDSTKADIYMHLSEVYEKLRNPAKALRYYKKYIAVRDELVNKETTKTINEIKMRYEVEQKEKEARLLKEKHDAINVYARKLEISNNELKQFAHVASHDLREPLRMVSTYMDLLQRSMKERLTPDQKQFIDFAVDGARRMDTLIHDLLRLAKVDANPHIQRISLSTVLAEVLQNIEVLVSEKRAKILSDSLPDIMADRTQVLQLFQNIISNGIKYNESGEPTITIGYRVEGATATLSIADNGIGIPAAYRERAFQIFQRVPTARQYQGSGIGLAICKKIVDGMGGTISIADVDGGGTVFHISVPIRIVAG